MDLLDACENGNLEAVERIIKEGANVNVKSRYYPRKTPLHKAARRGHLPVVAALLFNGADPNVPDTLRRTPLHRAAENGHEPVVSVFLSKGADPDKADKEGRTPLYWAAKNDHEPVVSALLSKGADPNIADTLGRTPLHWAAAKGQQHVMSALLSKGPDPNIADKEGRTPLYWVAKNGHEHVVSALLSKGADPNIADTTLGWTPLHWAAEYGHEPVVSALLSKGADPNIADKKGRTPLHWAAARGQEPVMSALLSKGADPNIADNEGETPLHLAVRDENEPVVSALLFKVADPNIANKNGETPLLLALRIGNEPAFSALLSKEADPNIANKNGDTPLHLAVRTGKGPVVSALLSKGADPNIADKEGWTPLHWAAEYGHEPVVSALLSKGADPNIADKKGRTPLHWAAARGQEPVMSALLSKGADPNIADKEGETPLLLAVRDENEPVVLTLLSEGTDPNIANKNGEAPLHWAVRKGKGPIVSALLSKGADPNIADKEGETPLILAVRNGNDSAFPALFSKGADPYKADKEGEIPLLFAVRDENEPVVSALLSKGADPNIADKDGETPLLLAVRNGNDSAFSALLSKGADPNIADKEGETPLLFAVRDENEPVVSALLSKGADPNINDKDGETPLLLAVRNGNDSAFSALLSKGADPNKADKEGEIPLLFAVRDENEPVVSALLSKGADPNIANINGNTPLHLAAMYGSRNMVLTLLQNGALLLETDAEGRNAMELARNNNNHRVSKLFQSLLESGLPKELLYLKTQDSNTFTSNLRSGFYLSFSGKIMSVGHEAVGKTAITTNLRGLKPSPKRKSTEGLDLHIYKAAIDMGTKKWVCKVLDIEDVAFRDLVSQPKILATTLEQITDENLDEDESTESVETEDTQSTDPVAGASCGSYDDRQETQLPRREKPKGNPILRWMKLKLGLRKASINTVEEILEEAVRRGKKGLVDSLLAPIIMMDFGGQTAFYSTHQAFLSYRGVYILVINGSKGIDEELETEMFIPGLHGKPTSRKFIMFWVGSIESFSTGTTDSFPKILVVCTHKDKVPTNEADQKVNAIFTEIEKMYEGTTTMKHLVLEHRIFLNALDPEDPDYDRLKDVLVELVCSQPTWGEKLPKAWIHLKMMINRSVEKGETIMTMNELREVNQENPVQVLSEKDLQLFLKMQHAQGEIIYFPLSGLRENIVISPTFLVDALRSLVTDSTFATGHRNKTVESMNKNGLLKQKDIGKIWKHNKKVLQHKDYLLPLLEHLDVIAVPRKYDRKGSFVKPEFYYVPSLVKKNDDTNYFQECNSRVLGLSFKFQSKILPPVIGYRLIASCVDMFEIQNFKGQILLFSGVVVLKVKRGLDIAVFLRPARVDVFLIHHFSRFQIIRNTASGIAECLKDIFRCIFENHKSTSSETQGKSGMPYTIEYPCFDCLSPCYSDDTDDWVCHGHGHSITKETKRIWEMNQMVESCPAECKGLIEADLDERPTELHLVKLAQQFNWTDMRYLLVNLKLNVTEIEACEEDYNGNLRNVAFLCLRKWKLQTNGTVGDVIRAMREAELDTHAACKMLRNRPMAKLNLSMEEPTDQLIDSISSEAITESLFLAIELGQSASSWLEMKDDRAKIVKINRSMLKEWQLASPKKDQMKDLAQALCNVGLNITSFVQEKNE